MLVPIPTGKTGEALVNRISNAIGVVFEPTRMRREAKAAIDVAKADVEIEVIRAEGHLRLTEVQERGIRRMVYEEGKNQENIESITMKAIPHLSTEAKPEDLDEDFVRHLFDKAKLISNDEMQELWAKILAGEANKAGSFSRRTLELVSQMSKSDAELFTRLCANVWIIGVPCPMLPQGQHAVRNADNYSMSFNDLNHLESIGLVHHGGEGYLRTNFSRHLTIAYHGCAVFLEFPQDNNNSLQIGSALLTSAGQELFKLALATPSRQSFEERLEQIISEGIRVSIPIVSKVVYPQSSGGGPN
jgi:hypothetical protein